MLLKVFQIISKFLNGKPTTSAIHRKERYLTTLLTVPPKLPEAVYCLGCDVQTLAWNSKSHNLDQDFLFRLAPISSSSSISSLIITPCRLIFSQISQLLYFQACYTSAHLVCGLSLAFFVLPVEKFLPLHTQPSHWRGRELLEENA